MYTRKVLGDKSESKVESEAIGIMIYEINGACKLLIIIGM